MRSYSLKAIAFKQSGTTLQSQRFATILKSIMRGYRPFEVEQFENQAVITVHMQREKGMLRASDVDLFTACEILRGFLNKSLGSADLLFSEFTS